MINKTHIRLEVNDLERIYSRIDLQRRVESTFERIADCIKNDPASANTLLGPELAQEANAISCEQKNLKDRNVERT